MPAGFVVRDVCETQRYLVFTLVAPYFVAVAGPRIGAETRRAGWLLHTMFLDRTSIIQIRQWKVA